jgi:hypothetical protein
MGRACLVDVLGVPGLVSSPDRAARPACPRPTRSPDRAVLFVVRARSRGGHLSDREPSNYPSRPVPARIAARCRCSSTDAPEHERPAKPRKSWTRTGPEAASRSSTHWPANSVPAGATATPCHTSLLPPWLSQRCRSESTRRQQLQAHRAGSSGHQQQMIHRRTCAGPTVRTAHGDDNRTSAAADERTPLSQQPTVVIG